MDVSFRTVSLVFYFPWCERVESLQLSKKINMSLFAARGDLNGYDTSSEFASGDDDWHVIIISYLQLISDQS